MKGNLGTILTAMVTPFDDDLKVDFGGLERLANHLLETGSDGLVVAGTTGESPTLSDDEKVAMFEAVVALLGGRACVIAGTGSNDTQHSVRLTRRAEAAGVDAVLVVAPYYNKPPLRGLIRHFQTIAAATSLPLVIYNIPSRCNVNLPAEALAELGRIENVVAVKQANPDLSELRHLREISDLGVYAGNDDMLLEVAKMGGWGGICVSSHLAGARMRRVVDLVRAGHVASAEALDGELSSLYRTLFITSNPIPVKCALGLLGLPAGDLRLPLVAADDSERQMIAAELRRQRLL
ncbi:MAG: 4-hydroxy-tetrahydrodipicolinate synthase [Thermoleophilia bacterium]|jgi:4-hydroxy-tetrahydrodipicolinate synthase